MKITLRGCNGKKREIPLEELIEKFWDDRWYGLCSNDWLFRPKG